MPCGQDDEADGRGAVDVHHLTEHYMPDSRMETAAIGPFEQAVNYVESSKDGRWLAVCVDLGYVVLMDERDRWVHPSHPRKLSQQQVVLEENGGWGVELSLIFTF